MSPGRLQCVLVIDDAAQLVGSEMKNKKGFSGTLIRSGYSVVKRLNKGRMIHEVLDGLMGEFTDALEPIHAEYRDGSEHKGFDTFLANQDERAVMALLGVTDKRAEKSKHSVLRKTYGKLRPRAEEHVRDALPGLGRLIEKHTTEA